MLAMDPDRAEPPVAEGDWHDAGSGLFGPLAWARILEVESARCRRYGRAATIVVLEAPGLEDVAATWGRDVSTVALARIGNVLKSVARSSDYVARIAPERFAVLLPETDEIAAVNFVERARPRCDEVLRSTEAQARCRFGWADARRTRPLDVAEGVAVSRLASDR